MYCTSVIIYKPCKTSQQSKYKQTPKYNYENPNPRANTTEKTLNPLIRCHLYSILLLI